MKDYAEFLASKARVVHDAGIEVEPGAIHDSLFDFQRAIVAWAVRKGRAAIFADCGLGKSRMQVEWARLIAPTSLILAPLSVARQTVREAAAIGVELRYVRDGAEVDGPGLYITNYEMAERFDPAAFEAVVLDESSRLKHESSVTRQLFTKMFAATPYRLCCTATPAPNDVAELCNHAEFLGIMPRVEMLASFFVHDEIGWRPKGHAVDPMYRWIASWAVAMRRPSDAGYEDAGFELPELRIIPEVLDIDIEADGQLFATDLGGIGGRSSVRRATLSARCERAVELASGPGQWLVWCGLNAEAEAVTRGIGAEAVNVEGSWSPDDKAAAFEAFQDGAIRVLVTKCSIAGFGMNFQNCHQMAFVGVSDSYESYYQAVRRCWRFGQSKPVSVHVVVSSLERQIVDNIKRKETEANVTTSGLVRYSPIRQSDGLDSTLAPIHRRVPRRMLASTARR